MKLLRFLREALCPDTSEKDDEIQRLREQISAYKSKVKSRDRHVRDLKALNEELRAEVDEYEKRREEQEPRVVKDLLLDTLDSSTDFYDFRDRGREDTQNYVDLRDEELWEERYKELFGEESFDSATAVVSDVYERHANHDVFDFYYLSDQRNNGVAEYWQSPEKTWETRRGDCEDLGGMMYQIICAGLRVHGYTSEQWRLYYWRGNCIPEGHYALMWLHTDGNFYNVETTSYEKQEYNQAWLKTPIHRSPRMIELWGAGNYEKSHNATLNQLRRFSEERVWT